MCNETTANENEKLKAKLPQDNQRKTREQDPEGEKFQRMEQSQEPF